jgi:hypothetical protein
MLETVPSLGAMGLEDSSSKTTDSISYCLFPASRHVMIARFCWIAGHDWTDFENAKNARTNSCPETLLFLLWREDARNARLFFSPTWEEPEHEHAASK